MLIELNSPSSNFLLHSPLSYEHIKKRTVAAHFKSPPPSPCPSNHASNSLSNQREEGGSKHLKTQRRLSQWGAQRGTRCPLRVAHRRVSDEVLVVSGAGSRERGPCGDSGSLITRQGQPGAPSEHEPLALPLATETKDTATTVPLRGGCVFVCLWGGDV